MRGEDLTGRRLELVSRRPPARPRFGDPPKRDPHRQRTSAGTPAAREATEPAPSSSRRQPLTGPDQRPDRYRAHTRNRSSRTSGRASRFVSSASPPMAAPCSSGSGISSTSSRTTLAAGTADVTAPNRLTRVQRHGGDLDLARSQGGRLLGWRVQDRQVSQLGRGSVAPASSDRSCAPTVNCYPDITLFVECEEQELGELARGEVVVAHEHQGASAVGQVRADGHALDVVERDAERTQVEQE